MIALYKTTFIYTIMHDSHVITIDPNSGILNSKTHNYPERKTERLGYMCNLSFFLAEGLLLYI